MKPVIVSNVTSYCGQCNQLLLVMKPVILSYETSSCE